MDVPIIETERLVLRAHRIEDFPSFARMWADPHFVRFLDQSTPLPEEDAWARFLRHPGYWQFLGYGVWAIEEKETHRFVGNAGFSDRKRTICSTLFSVPEMGWSLSSTVQGNGYATEAACAAIEWADANLPDEKTVCAIRPDNLASLKVAAKCGYRECARIEYRGVSYIVFFRMR